MVSITWILVYFKLYRLALMSSTFLAINNNKQLKEMINDYMKQRQEFTKYYKNNFLTFYYVLPFIEILSKLEMSYTGYLLKQHLSKKYY